MHNVIACATSVRAPLRGNKKPPGRAASLGKPSLRTARPAQLDVATVEALQGAFQGAFQDAQRFRPARRALRRTTPSATMAAVEISGAGAAIEPGSTLESDCPLSAVVEVRKRGAEAGVGDVRPGLAPGNELDPVDDIVGRDHGGRGVLQSSPAHGAKDGTRGSGAAGPAKRRGRLQCDGADNRLRPRRPGRVNRLRARPADINRSDCGHSGQSQRRPLNPRLHTVLLSLFARGHARSVHQRE